MNSPIPRTVVGVDVSIACISACAREKAALCHRSASTDVVASTIRSDCYRLERQLPGGIRTR